MILLFDRKGKKLSSIEACKPVKIVQNCVSLPIGKGVDTKRGWRRYKVPGGRGKTEFLEYNQDTLDQSTVGKIPYMYLPQSEKDCYVVVVIQRDLPR